MRLAVLGCCLLAAIAGAREITEKDVPDLHHYRALLKRIKDLPQVSGPRNPLLQRAKRSLVAATTCSNSQVTGCLKSFLTPFGISSLPANPQTLINALFNYYTANKAPGYVSVCAQLVALQQCLPPPMWGACFNPVTMVKQLGFSYTAALQYITIFDGLPYACSTAASPILNNWSCASNILQTQTAALTTCQNDMIQRISSSPNAACLAYQIFVACYAIPFHSPCGENVSYSVCQTLRRGLIAAAPQCASLTCSYVAH